MNLDISYLSVKKQKQGALNSKAPCFIIKSPVLTFQKT